MQIRVLTGDDIRRALPMKVAIEGMKQAFAQLSSRQAFAPHPSRMEIGYTGLALMLPGRTKQSAAIEIVSIFPHNLASGLPSSYALVVAFDPAHGRPLALLEGSVLEAIAAGAAAGAATDVLARADSEVVAIFGSDEPARMELEAIRAVRPIREARVYSPNREYAAAFAQEMGAQAFSTPPETVAGADIVCTATFKPRPAFPGRHLKPGVSINTVDSYAIDTQDVDGETLRRALVVVDSRKTVLAEAAQIRVPLGTGNLSESLVYAEIGEILAGTKPGRTSAEQTTYFKSCCVGVQNAVAAGLAVERAAAENLGVVVEL